MNKLLKGNKVTAPTFDFIEGKKIFNKHLQMGEKDILVIESTKMYLWLKPRGLRTLKYPILHASLIFTYLYQLLPALGAVFYHALFSSAEILCSFRAI